MRGQWGESFERRCGFWRGFVDEQVRRYLDCGLFENGFARIRCPDCAEEYLLAFSCKTRELCPSCAAKRSAATAALLAEEVFKEVGHAQWVFVMPKMLRPYFLHHRALLGGLAHAAWETVLKLMCVAVGALHRDVPGTALCRNDHPASGALRTMPMPGTPREARQTLVVPARMEAVGALSAWSQTFRLPYQRPR